MSKHFWLFHVNARMDSGAQRAHLLSTFSNCLFFCQSPPILSFRIKILLQKYFIYEAFVLAGESERWSVNVALRCVQSKEMLRCICYCGNVVFGCVAFQMLRCVVFEMWCLKCCVWNVAFEMLRMEMCQSKGEREMEEEMIVEMIIEQWAMMNNEMWRVQCSGGYDDDICVIVRGILLRIEE